MLEVDLRHITDMEDAIKGILEKKEGAEANGLTTLQEKLRIGMRLEATTIPPYLTAAYTIRSSRDYQNADVKAVLLRIAKEEMMHMMAIANLITATGKNPNLHNRDMLHDWGNKQEPLPVGTTDLIPEIIPFSKEYLAGFFMKLEKPNHPFVYRVLKSAPGDKPATIADFYKSIKGLIEALPSNLFDPGKTRPQIDFNSKWISMQSIDHLPITCFKVKNKQQAYDIIDWIVGQGEGSEKGPKTESGAEMAHWYVLSEIYEGGKLVPSGEKFPKDYMYDAKNKKIQVNMKRVYKFKYEKQGPEPRSPNLNNS